MKKILSLVFFNLLLIGLIASSEVDQETKGILEKMIKAGGGREILESIKDTTLLGIQKTLPWNISGVLTIYKKEPNKALIDIEYSQITLTVGFDGETAWMVDHQTGKAEEMPEKSAAEVKRGALGYQALLHPEKYGITYTYKGKEKIENKDYLVLEQTYADGYKETHCIDPITFLIYKTKGTTFNEKGVEGETEKVVSDYKEVNGVMIPCLITVFLDGKEAQKITILKISFNKDLEDSFFNMIK